MSAAPQDLRVQDPRKRADRRKSPWLLRWTVDGAQTEKWFRTRDLAGRYRRALKGEHEGGMLFGAGRGNGYPTSWVEGAPGLEAPTVWATFR